MTAEEYRAPGALWEDMIMFRKVGFIGTGNMGSAVAKAVSVSGLAEEILLANRTPAKAQALCEQIAGARRCIGKGGAENASVKEKLTDGMTTISVLTSLALEESVVTADSMNSRGYGAAKRSCYHSYRFAGADLAAVLVFAALCGVSIAALVKGSGSANYTPDLVIAPIEGWGIPGIAAYTFFLLIPTILNIKEEIQWHISRSKI